MSRDFEELDYQQTPLGELILRRRIMHSLGGIEIHEVKLGDAFLMSSLFHEVEVALSHLGLGELEGTDWDVVVGGLGLGYTAVAALEHPEIRSLLVVDALQPVIGWHQRGLVPLGTQLTDEARCRLVEEDFLPLPGRGTASIRSGPADVSTPFCSISITRLVICFIRATPRFTPPRA